ncbi:MAG: hypothetical protein HZB81_01735 [Deltaproteobacteria bacterium]|nr:hypothetical protein [Deltaproteobacteria bacterium]
MKNIFLSLMLLLLLPVIVFGKVKDNKPVLIIMASEPGGKKTNQFSCRSRVYADFVFKEKKSGNHMIEAIWIRPDGKRQEHTRYESAGNRAWLWLELHPSFGGKLFGAIDQSAGMDEFIGEWKLKVYLDGKFLERKSFYVIC